MAAFYHTFQSSRTTQPDITSLLALLRAQDTTAGIQYTPATQNYVIKKSTSFTQAQINFIQNTIDTSPVSTPQLTAQTYFDSLSIIERAKILVQLDQFNLIRSKLVPPLGSITEEQMIAAIRTKAGTL